MRRAFTLIELLVIVGIIAVMVSASVFSIQSGQDGARIRGAVRDVFAAIRHARSVALVTQQPAVITYATERDGDDVIARVSVTSAKLMSTEGRARNVQTLSGEPVDLGEEEGAPDEQYELVHVEGRDATADEPSAGQTMEDILFAPIADDVVRGVRVRVLRGDELLEAEDAQAERSKTKVSVFSNVDYLLNRFTDARKAAREKEREAESPADGASATAEELPPKVDLVWEVNGRVEPHRVWVYLDGKDPESGYCIKIDRFGAARILGEEDE